VTWGIARHALAPRNGPGSVQGHGVSRLQTRNFFIVLFVTLFSACFPVFCQSAQSQAGSPPVADPPDTPGNPKPTEGRPDDAKVPLPDSGQTGAYTYSREPGVPGVYRIYPGDGSASYLVSENFLQLILSDSRLDSEKQEMVLHGYQSQNEQLFQHIMNQAYPDASHGDKEGFQSQRFAGADGTSALLEQDPYAQPYVRVTIKTADGTTSSFSIARGMVEQSLANGNLTDEQKIQALLSYPFPLPEDIRHRFNSLSTSELAEIVQNTPALQSQEFIKMRHVYRNFSQQPHQKDDRTIVERNARNLSSPPRNVEEQTNSARLQPPFPSQNESLPSSKEAEVKWRGELNRTAPNLLQPSTGLLSEMETFRQESRRAAILSLAAFILVVGLGALVLFRFRRS
jgi:hypothetical protein